MGDNGAALNETAACGGFNETFGLASLNETVAAATLIPISGSCPDTIGREILPPGSTGD